MRRTAAAQKSRIAALDIPDAVVAEHFPIDGPYDDDHTIAAARTIAELVRYLNHATFHRAAVQWPATANRVLGALSDAAYGQVQTYEQIGLRVAAAADHPNAYVSVPLEWGPTPCEAAKHLRHVALGQAIDEVARLCGALGEATTYAGVIGIDEDGEC